jgi:hypothetical protein
MTAAAAAVLALAATGVLITQAEEPASGAAPAQVAPATEAASAVPGCPGKPDGSCCGSSACREAKQQPAEGKAAVGGCPCQRAREAAAAAQKGG